MFESKYASYPSVTSSEAAGLFALKGLNGVHEVLALEPLGRNLQQFIDEM